MKKIITLILAICILLSVTAIAASADTVYYYGDVDKNGSETINASDLSYLCNILLGKQTTNDMADLNGDLDVDILDLVCLKKVIANPSNGVNITYGSYTEVTDSNS